MIARASPEDPNAKDVGLPAKLSRTKPRRVKLSSPQRITQQQLQDCAEQKNVPLALRQPTFLSRTSFSSCRCHRTVGTDKAPESSVDSGCVRIFYPSLKDRCAYQGSPLEGDGCYPPTFRADPDILCEMARDGNCRYDQADLAACYPEHRCVTASRVPLFVALRESVYCIQQQ